MNFPPQTPQRPVPGGFVSTPAMNGGRYQAGPIRQPNFGQPMGGRVAPGPNSNDGQPNPQSREAPPPKALQPIQRAARTINEVLQREASFPDLDSYVKQGISSDYDITLDPAWAPFQRSEIHPIPEKIYEQYNRAEVSTMMGLFAELNHAWVTIDSALYIWDYTDPNAELIGYEDQGNSITAVKLVTPRAGVFVQDITHLLVLATTVEMILIGVAAPLLASGVRTMTLFQTKMSANLRGCNVQSIEGSPATGRIFFSGSNDNELHELTYKEEESWFQSRCGILNHTDTRMVAFLPGIWGTRSQERTVQMCIDDSRQLLYTLSTDSTIRTFYMNGPETLQAVIEKKRTECLRDISHMITQSSLLTNNMRICSISPIPAKEGVKLHLMATTHTGCRLFLSATRGGYGYSGGQGAPQSMQVQHIKFPPRGPERGPPSQAVITQGYQQGEPAQTEANSMALAYTQKGLRFPPGLFFCFVIKQDPVGEDSLFLSGPDTGRIAAQFRDLTTQASRFYEQSCWIKLSSHAEDIGMVTQPFAAANQPIGFGNELAVQYDEPVQEVAILTNTGVHVIRRRRLVDIFAAAIRNQGGDEGLENEVKKFIRNYGRAETTATALAVACGQGSDISPGDGRTGRISSPETLEMARKCFVEFGGRPSLNENMVSEPSQAVDNIRPSSRHEGLALYMGRLVRSVWKASVITQVVPTANGGMMTITSTVTQKRLTSIQEDLQKLSTFLEKNKSFIEGLAGPESLQRAASQQEEIALQGEHQALYSLQRLNSNIIEGISFVQMLFDERVDEIWTALDDTTKQRLRDLTYEVLFSSDQGKDLAKVLVKAIVNRNIANGSNVDTVADALRRRCGSFCSADDVIIFKAQEQLKKASSVGPNSDMGRKLLNESLKLFTQVANALSYENLQGAVEHFTSLQFYAGAISLALHVAQESDRGNRALAWSNENKPADDARIPLFNFRKQCYDLIHQIILAVEDATRAEPEMIDGRLTLIATKRNEAQSVVNDSEDELFQFDLYDWYLQQGKIEQLLDTDSAFVVQFLTKSASSSLDRADLLWKLYVRHERFFEAASVQLELAKSEFPITLSKRMEYLSRAKANASTQNQNIGRQAKQVLLYEISELLDVANIQDVLLHKLRADERDMTQRDTVIDTLDGPILNLTVLFNEYADQASYSDICLEIYEAADHRNEADIAATWQTLLENTHSDVADNRNAQQQPYEAVITMVRQMAQRLGHSEVTFSPQLIIPMLERYYVENIAGTPEWLPELLIDVKFPFETIISILQSMWYTNSPPFTGSRRRVLSQHIIYVLNQWYEDCIKSNTRIYGTESNAQEVMDFLEQLEKRPGDLNPADLTACGDLKRKLARSINWG